MSKKFYYVTRRNLDKMHQLFESKDPRLTVLLNEFGEYADIARYSDKYDTVVFTTVRRSAVETVL